MSSPSKASNSQQMVDEAQVKSVVNEQLDASINNLDKSTLADIAQVRTIALKNMAKRKKYTSYRQLFLRFVDDLSHYSVTPWLTSFAAVLMIVISVNYLSVEAIPELPLAMMDSELPSEDLALLEDLEFLTWLAKNEMDAVL